VFWRHLLSRTVASMVMIRLSHCSTLGRGRGRHEHGERRDGARAARGALLAAERGGRARGGEGGGGRSPQTVGREGGGRGTQATTVSGPNPDCTSTPVRSHSKGTRALDPHGGVHTSELALKGSEHLFCPSRRHPEQPEEPRTIAEAYDRLVSGIVRPPRMTYETRTLGPQRMQLSSGVVVQRTDFRVRDGLYTHPGDHGAAH
jgi:hypothetical protein